MKAAFVILGMISVLSQNSYAFGNGRSSAGSTPDPTTPSSPALPAPPDADIGTGGLKIQINSTTNFTSDQIIQAEQARAALETVVNSEAFKQKVIHFTYQGAEAFVQNNGLTNLQIYNQMMAGAEVLPQQTAVDNVMNLFLELYTSSYFGRNVIGYTDPSVHTIYMNTYYYNSAAKNDIADNMMHEWMHKLGYDHDYQATARRPSSVPYAIGYIVDDLVAAQQ